jgi:hypothetical protein
VLLGEHVKRGQGATNCNFRVSTPEDTVRGLLSLPGATWDVCNSQVGLPISQAGVEKVAIE